MNSKKYSWILKHVHNLKKCSWLLRNIHELKCEKRKGKRKKGKIKPKEKLLKPIKTQKRKEKTPVNTSKPENSAGPMRHTLGAQ